MYRYKEAEEIATRIYQIDATWLDNLLLLGAIHLQLHNHSESIFYNQQAIRVDPEFAEAFSNLGNALKELGDLEGSIQVRTLLSAALPLTRTLHSSTSLPTAIARLYTPVEIISLI